MSKKLHKDSRYEKECKAQRKKAKRRAKLYSFALFSTVLLALILCYTCVLVPTRKYDEAKNEMENGSWQTAQKSFEELGSFKDSKRLAAYTRCMRLFSEGKLNEACEAYLQLNENDQRIVQNALGSFALLADQAMEEGRYGDAYTYYSLDLDNPERDDAMYAITVYLDCEKLLRQNKYDEARSEISACLEVSHALSSPLQSLLDSSYESEFDYYDSFTWTDLAFAVDGMQTLCEVYEPAHIYLRDLQSAYYGGILSMREGKYDDAIEQFEDIVAYSDCAQKLDECRMLLANEQAAAGRSEEALETVKLVSNWEEYVDLLPEGSSLTTLLTASGIQAEGADGLGA